ncbi:hypothetical protein D9756_006864 [Leucocoprinus leucothites]|uniref:DUF6699 domain-containing protein n=1 Tax=Leucocoprinus leucothites TaxID=201217 RepID=A0A8H5LHC6_9AGAR|nr:hypothetical protein D9756_006864 [Leucoagaricus leucothites]
MDRDLPALSRPQMNEDSPSWIDEGHQRLREHLEFPATPKSLAKALPPCLDDDGDQNQTIATSNTVQLLPDFLLFQDEALPCVDVRIAFQERIRCVAQPTITFMPEYPGYLWGAVTSHIATRDDGTRVHFEDITEPATNPAVSRMRIAIGSGGATHWLEVQRQGDASCITVADIQKTVIEWMRGASRTRRSGSPRFSDWVTLIDEDGVEIELEVWIWKGLRPLDNTLENWELEFAEEVTDC